MKFEEFMNESAAPKNIDAIIAKIERATNDNAHTHSWIILSSEILKNKKLTEAFQALQSIQDFLKRLPEGGQSVRDELSRIAMEQVKEDFPNEVKKIKAAF